MDFNYKKYSLERLKEWMYDAISSAEATPQEIYDVIKGVVDEQYHYHKHHTGRCYDLLALLNGNGKGHIKAYDDYMNTKSTKEKDKVVKWQLPIEVDGPSGEYFITFPDDLLEAANLKEGDQVEWVDQGDGSYLLKKVEKQMTYDEAIAAGWEITADGFWIKE
jgi:antitoxin component of MazEF toxin-antitoxin module